MTITKQKTIRQRLRSALLLFSLLLFPITLNYFSPYLIMMGASQGVINGSFLVFAGMFVLSLFVGRLWCGWICPAGALGEVLQLVNNNPVNGRKIDWIKWAIWVPWIALIGFIAAKAGGYHGVDFLFGTVNGISVAGDADRPIQYAYVIYYGVISLFAVLSVTVGRRTGCHTVCWMAPFMILGRKVSNQLHLPALKLTADAQKCTNCQTCTTNCPMSLDVNAMVQRSDMEHAECILCGNCADGCKVKAIRYVFQSRTKQKIKSY
jgi:ferredoxin-type protein NapH